MGIARCASHSTQPLNILWPPPINVRVAEPPSHPVPALNLVFWNLKV